MLTQTDKIALFIDSANLQAATSALDFEIDYERLLAEFRRRGRLLRATVYAAAPAEQGNAYIATFAEWLIGIGYKVVAKGAKEFLDAAGRRKVKYSINVELAVAAIELAGHVDNVILFSGDGDLRPLVRALQRCGVRVTVVSTAWSNPSMVADELRLEADEFIDLVALQPAIERAASDALHGRESADAGLNGRKTATVHGNETRQESQ